jgi:hypothetical protein
LFGADPEFVEADRIREDSGCVPRYDRSFLRPLLPPAAQPVHADGLTAPANVGR